MSNYLAQLGFLREREDADRQLGELAVQQYKSGEPQRGGYPLLKTMYIDLQSITPISTPK